MAKPALSLEERFWPKVAKGSDEECWLWLASKTAFGYGRFWPGGKPGTIPAHRVAYVLLRGDVPDGLELDHLCRNPACVNPSHLEAVTHRENVIRGLAPAVTSARHAATTHCANGHRFDEATTYIAPRSGKRMCLTCRNERSKAWQEANRGRAKANRRRWYLRQKRAGARVA